MAERTEATEAGAADPAAGIEAAGSPHATPQPKSRKQPRPPTPARLERWALYYLGRHASSASNLRRVLMRRVEKHAAELKTDVEACRSDVDILVARLVEQEYVDDRRFAEGIVKRMRARGASRLRVQASLLQKGVSAELASDALGSSEAKGDGGDLVAAARYARRRRLGPFRLDPEQRSDRLQRDLGALARAGFSYSIASRVIDAPDCDTVDEWIEAEPT